MRAAAMHTASGNPPHLRLVVGVVEHDQDPAAGEVTAVHRDPLVRVVRHRRAVHAERPQELAEDVVWVGRRGLAAA
jgi:hypothetical protein